MRDSDPSRTALRVAIRRAAHQVFDRPLVFEDPVAIPIIGVEAAAALEASGSKEHSRLAQALRAFMAVRSRFAEDHLAQAVARGTAQYVILGAGLDTFAYRNPHPALRVFEVDHPSTQTWKRGQLAAAGIAIPPSVTFAPVDFERQTLTEGLDRAGLDRTAPAFFSWLGVTMYLTEEAIAATLATIAATPGAGVVFDYGVPRSSLGLLSRLAHDAISARVAAIGEPFRTFFTPDALESQLRALGFTSIEDLGAAEINARYFANRSDGLCVRGEFGRLLGAR